MQQEQIQSAARPPFAIWLKTERKKRNMTMEALADAAGTAAPVISNLERGTRNASRDMVRRLVGGLVDPALTAEAAHAERARLLNEGLDAAGFRAREYQYPDFHPLHSIIRDIGYDERDFADEELLQMRDGVEALIEGYAVKKKRMAQAA